MHSPQAGGSAPALDESTKANAWQTGFNLTNLLFGAGLLSLPWGMAGSGLISGVLIIFLGLILNAATSMIFIVTGEKYKKFDTGALCQLIPGRLGKVLSVSANAGIWISQFLCLIANTIIFSDSLDTIMDGYGHRWIWVLVFGAMTLPLSMLPQKYLGFTSFVSIAVNVYLVCIIVKNFAEQGPKKDRVCIFGYGRGTLAMVCTFSMSSVLQYCAFPMYEEFQDATPKRFLNVLIISWSFVFLIFATFTSFAYMTYGELVESDIIDMLDADVYGNISRGGISVVVTCCYPLMVAPMLQPVRELLEPRSQGYETLNDGKKEKSKWKYYKPFIVTGIVGFATACTLFVDSLGFVNVLNGALSLFLFVCGLPALFGLYLWENTRFMTFVYYLLGFFGTSMAIFGLIFTDNYHEEVMGHCPMRL